jgi:hypothetical protein
MPRKYLPLSNSNISIFELRQDSNAPSLAQASTSTSIANTHQPCNAFSRLNMEVATPPPALRTVVDSIVYRPSPQPKRKRSPSPPHSPPRRPKNMYPRTTLPDIDPERAMERERQLQERLAQQEKEKKEKKPFDPKEEYERMLNARSGGVYIPPARLRALQAQFTDKKSKEYQRMAWEALKKSINGLINKVLQPLTMLMLGQHIKYQDDCR